MIKRDKIARRILDQRGKGLLWTKKYAPIEEKDIPLFRMSQVENFVNLLSNCLNRIPNTPKVIVITGPVGCGKTTLVKVVCQQRNISIRKFQPDNEDDLPKDKLDNESNLIIKLKLFLEKSQPPQLLLGNVTPQQKQILLIDDITLNQVERVNFFNVINQYNKSPRLLFPLIWIADPNDTQRKISDCYYFTFPAASRTVLKRVLKRISQDEHLNLKDSQLNAFIDDNPGDVRLAVNMIQFARTFSAGKYDYLSYFQAIGEILYQKNRISSEDILRISQCSPRMMIKGLYENSLDFFADISEYADCAEEFSVADTFMGIDFMVPELAELSATTAMRGILTSLKTVQEKRFFSMRPGYRSHLRNNYFKSDLYHQELLIQNLMTENEDYLGAYHDVSEQANDTFQCWPQECKMNPGQMDSILFDESEDKVYVKKRSQMEIEREREIKDQELSEAMKLLSLDPIDSSDDGFFSDNENEGKYEAKF